MQLRAAWSDMVSRIRSFYAVPHPGIAHNNARRQHLPAARKINCPISAGFFEPETGASKKVAPVTLSSKRNVTDLPTPVDGALGSGQGKNLGWSKSPNTPTTTKEAGSREKEMHRIRDLNHGDMRMETKERNDFTGTDKALGLSNDLY
jgi:hypothetical protein